MPIRIGINGFGRIGRIAARILLNSSEFELVAINSLSDASSHAYLLQYDSVYRSFEMPVRAKGNNLVVGTNEIKCFQESTPATIPWQKAKVDIVLECSGIFRTSSAVQGHLGSGARQVIISAPVKDETPTYVWGVNHELYNPKTDAIISNSSCTTNCVATVVKALHDAFGVVRGTMITIHAVTNSQNLLDNWHKKDLRLGRSAMENLIPTSSGSGQDVAKLFPHLKGKLPCRAVRVPTPTVSLIDLVVVVDKATYVDEVNQVFITASQSLLKGIVAVAKEELVSTDYVGSAYSAIVDPFLTDVVEGTLVHVVAWYDNEWGYTTRLVEMASYVARKVGLV